MKQGDGSDLPGVDSPRNADIGIIYVAPNDDRQSVLAAIFTQEKLGRKQVAIVLPDQNKAFQRPVDFDGLKNMRRGLRTHIVFVAPGSSGPAELARQRRFPVYSSLENYAKSVQDDGQHIVVKRKGWLSPLSRQRPADASSVTPIAPIKVRQVRPLPKAVEATAQQAKTKNGNTQGTPGPLPDAAAIAGASTVIDSGILAASEGSPSTPASIENGADALPLAVPVVAAQSAASSVPEDTPTQELSGVLPPADSPASVGGAGAKIIPISSARGGTTDKISIPAITSTPAAQPQVPQVSAAGSSMSTRRQSMGSVAVIGAGVGLAATGGSTTARVVRAGGTPPPRGSAAGSSGGSPGSPRRPARRGLLIALVALLLALLAVFGTIAFAYPGMFSHLNIPIPGITSSATVTITPASKDVKNTYTIFGVTGSPDQALRQVQARQLNSTTPAQSKTATATGTGHTPGVPATGRITFYNGAGVDQLVSAGTTFNVNGLQIVTDQTVDIPPANPPAAFGIASVSAHAAEVGPGGDIGELSIDQLCCSSKSVFAKNLNPFSGGQDPQSFTVVQQSDIDGAASPLKTMLMSAAQQSLQSQVQSSERFISTPQCSPNVSSDHASGDRVSSVMVTVKVSCSGEVYDSQGVQTIAANLLKLQAATDPGPGYVLVGNLVTGITKVMVTDASKGTLELIVTAEGVWVYQFSDTQKAMLAKLIAGKSKQAAQALLAQQMGVENADIRLTGGDGKTLPTDPAQITINVLTVTGLQGTSPTPTSTIGPGLGTPTAPAAAPETPTVTTTITPTVGLGSGG